MGRNARIKRERRAARLGGTVRLVNPAEHHFASYILENAARCTEVVQPDSAKGQHLILCGAGPSLAEHAAEWCPQGDEVWACNSALPWLIEHGHRVTHGFTVDQIGAMSTRWASAPDVDYLLASSVHPKIAQQLRAAGRNLRYFHNTVSLSSQDALYVQHYPPTICAGSGLSSVTRALDVADYMGFEKITVLGADCCVRVKPGAPPRSSVIPGTPEYDAWIRDYTTMHANGDNPVDGGCSPVTLSGVIDGREWVMQPDMAISAVWLVRMARASRGTITIVGDHFVNAIIDKPRSFLDRLPHSVDATGKAIPIRF